MKLPKNYIIVVHVFANFTKHHFKMPWISGNLHKTYAYFHNGHSSRILVYKLVHYKTRASKESKHSVTNFNTIVQLAKPV